MSLFLLDIGKPAMFIHVPRTGGSSIRQGFDIGGGFRLYDPPSGWSNHPSFAFVRDPFDRIESCWRYFRFLLNHISVGYETFIAQFVEGFDEVALKSSIDDPTTINHHIAPMTHPVHGLKHAEFIGKFNTLQEDYSRFCGVQSIKTRVLPVVLKSQQLAPKQLISPYIYRVIEKIYKDDLEMFHAN